jgi:WD40 repeat protein
MLATGNEDRVVRLWETSSLLQIAGPLTGHTRAVEALAFNPGRTVLTSGAVDSTACTWGVVSREDVDAQSCARVA